MGRTEERENRRLFREKRDAARKGPVRIPFIDKIPIIGPVVNDVVDGTTPLGGGEVKSPAGVETKVTAATMASFVMALLAPLLAKLPPPIGWIAALILPPIVTAIAGYFAPHTTRK